MRRLLAVIPARGGSKGILNKNIVDLCGKPLIAYTIEAAFEVREIKDVVVSTDSEAIAKIAEECGAVVPYLRPENLADDSAQILDVLIDLLNRLVTIGKEYDDIVLLQPTSPFRNSENIREALMIYYSEGADSLVSVTESPIAAELICRVSPTGELIRLVENVGSSNRQSFQRTYIYNGAIYITSVRNLMQHRSFHHGRTLPYIMTSVSSVDIDLPEDLEMAKRIMKEQNREE